MYQLIDTYTKLFPDMNKESREKFS